MEETKKYQKWCLNINKEEIGMPTKEHALRLGRFLRAYNVPLKVIEVVVSVRKTEDGTVRHIKTKHFNRSQLMDE